MTQCVLLARLCQPFPCFILYSKAKFACYSRYLQISCFCIPAPYNEKDIFFGCQFQTVLQVFIEPFSFFSFTGWGTGLDYYDIEWLSWKQTEIILSFLRLHPSTAFWTFFLTIRATPFLLRDSCKQQQIQWSKFAHSSLL